MVKVCFAVTFAPISLVPLPPPPSPSLLVGFCCGFVVFYFWWKQQEEKYVLLGKFSLWTKDFGFWFYQFSYWDGDWIMWSIGECEAFTTKDAAWSHTAVEKFFLTCPYRIMRDQIPEIVSNVPVLNLKLEWYLVLLLHFAESHVIFTGWGRRLIGGVKVIVVKHLKQDIMRHSNE